MISWSHVFHFETFNIHTQLYILFSKADYTYLCSSLYYKKIPFYLPPSQNTISWHFDNSYSIISERKPPCGFDLDSHNDKWQRTYFHFWSVWHLNGFFEKFRTPAQFYYRVYFCCMFVCWWKNILILQEEKTGIARYIIVKLQIYCLSNISNFIHSFLQWVQCQFVLVIFFFS